MPVPALPESWNAAPDHRYTDERGRPLRGEVVVLRDGEAIVTMAVRDGDVSLEGLPSARYELRANLRTPEGTKVRRQDFVDLR